MTKALLDANTLIAALGEGVGPIINESAPRTGLRALILPRTDCPGWGTSYLLRGIYKEGGGGDYMQVAWRKEGNPQPASTLQPIPGTFDPWAGPPFVTSQPVSVAVDPGGTASFSVAADLGARSLSYQCSAAG